MISLLVGLKNNLDYNKHFYETTRKIYPNVEICFVSYGSTDGTHEWLDELEDENIKYFYSKESKTFSETFNKAAEIATKKYVAYLHNDIVLTPGFLENLEKHLSESNVVSYTTIEPPIFAGHERPGKIIKDFGLSLENFNFELLNEFSRNRQKFDVDKTEPGITFFMCMPRQKLLEIGGMDSLYNPMFCEDDDLIRRWKMLGMNCFTSLDSICYHFVSKTSRFSDEYLNISKEIELHSNRNYIRKWGSRSDAPKYSKSLILTNTNSNILYHLEPWFDRVYVDEVLIEKYINREQINTSFELSQKILPNQINISDDIVVRLDCNSINQETFNLIQKLSEIIKDSGEIGTFKLGNLTIEVNSLQEYQNDLIFINNNQHK